jgi:hypothetical protein
MAGPEEALFSTNYSSLCSYSFSLGSFPGLYLNMVFLARLPLFAACFLTVAYLVYCSTPKTSAVSFPETLIKF